MRFIIVTGMSGAGKSQALKILEDFGFYCVDNIPLPILENFAVWAGERPDDTKIALGLDVRTGDDMMGIEGYLELPAVSRLNPELLFLDASDECLIKRYKETRRNHPFEQEAGSIEGAISLERGRLKELKVRADIVTDTSYMLTKDLRAQLDEIILQGMGYKNLNVTIMSFGFKYGIPTEADLVFDVRFLPNPFYVEELKNLTGNDKAVSDFVKNSPVTEEFIEKLTAMIKFLLPNFVAEGKNQIMIAVGCTGGRHRSVTIANELYSSLCDLGYGLKLEHREI